MDDARLERVGKAFGQIVDLIAGDASLTERLTAFAVLVGQVAFEYQASEDQAREEGRQAGYVDGHAASRAEGWASGFFDGQQAGLVQGRQEVQQEVERTITGEPTATADPGAAEPAATESAPDARDEETGGPGPKVSVH